MSTETELERERERERERTRNARANASARGTRARTRARTRAHLSHFSAIYQRMADLRGCEDYRFEIRLVSPQWIEACVAEQRLKVRAVYVEVPFMLRSRRWYYVPTLVVIEK